MNIEVDLDAGRPYRLFMVAAVSERANSALAVVFFVTSPHFGTRLRAIDYRLSELGRVHDPRWLLEIYQHAGKLRDAYNVYGDREVILYAEGLLHQGLYRTLTGDKALYNAAESNECDLYEIDRPDILAMNFEQRMQAAQMLAGGGTLLKIRAAARARSVFRNLNAPHLLNQLAAILPGRKEPQELAHALSLGALLELTDETTVPRGSGSSSLGSISAFGG